MQQPRRLFLFLCVCHSDWQSTVETGGCGWDVSNLGVDQILVVGNWTGDTRRDIPFEMQRLFVHGHLTKRYSYTTPKIWMVSLNEIELDILGLKHLWFGTMLKSTQATLVAFCQSVCVLCWCHFHCCSSVIPSFGIDSFLAVIKEGSPEISILPPNIT